LPGQGHQVYEKPPEIPPGGFFVPKTIEHMTDNMCNSVAIVRFSFYNCNIVALTV
jgi:hypothetical protein